MTQAPPARQRAFVALTLGDGDTPVWLDADLAAAPEVAEWLAFQTGAVTTTAPSSAALALATGAADGQGEWEDGYNSGALRNAVDSGLVDMNDIVEIWKSKPIPEGPIVLRRALPEDVKTKVTALIEGLHAKDAQCAYNMAAGETAGFAPITHDAYETMIALRQSQGN